MPGAEEVGSASPAAMRVHGGESDEWLVEHVRRGDAEAFDALVCRHMRRAFSVAYRVMGHREDAEDVVQDAFVRALERIDTFESGRSFVPWLYRIVLNRALNARSARTVRRADPIPESAPARSASPLEQTERSEARARIHGALATLTDQQQTIVRLFELEGFSGPEIAELLELPQGTVRWQLHEARKALRDALAPQTRRSS